MVKKNFVFSLTEKVFRAALTFVSLGIVARYLGPASYGFLSYLLAILTYFQLIGAFGLDQMLMRLFAEEPDRKAEIYWHSVIFKSIFTIFAVLLYWIFLLISEEFNFLSWALGLIILSSVFDNNRIYMESQNKHHLVARVEIIYQVISALLKIVSASLDSGIGFIYCIFIMDFLITKILLFLIVRKEVLVPSDFKFRFTNFKYFVNAGGFHCLSTIFTIAYMKADQVMIGKMMGMSDLGNYAAAVRLSDAWYFVPITISAVFYPLALTKMMEKNNSFVQAIFDLTLWISVAVIGLALIFSDDIFNLMFGTEFSVDKLVLNLLFLSGLFISLSISTAAWLNVKNHKRVLFIRTFAGATINILLNLYLIPKYGLVGAAYSTFIAYGVTIVVTFIAGDSLECCQYIVRSFNLYRSFNRCFDLLVKRNS